LLGFTGVWIDMEGGANYQAIVRYDILPPMLAAADVSNSSRQGSAVDRDGGGSLGGGGYLVLARYLYEEVMFFVAGLVAEVKIAGYPADYIEVDVAGRTSVDWDAIRVARLKTGLPICGHKDCTIPFEAGCDAERVAEVIKHAEDEVFTLLKANWLVVERVVNVLCKQDRLTTPELDAIITGSESAGSGSAGPGDASPDSAGKPPRRRRKPVHSKPARSNSEASGVRAS
jgi:hypothetical protein